MYHTYLKAVTIAGRTDTYEEVRSMVVSTKLAAAVMGGLLLAAVYTPAWAGSAGDTTAAGQPSTAVSADRSLVGVLSPLFADAAPHQAQKTCKSDSLYSQHSVVGDPDACFLNRVDVRASSAGGNPGLGGAL